MKRFLTAFIILIFVGWFGKIIAADDVATIQAHLNNLFTDFSYTELKSDINASNLESNNDYNSLPDVLKSMTMKIAKGDWSETNTYNGKEADWRDSYARKYRVQMYEPYSEGGAAASMAGISQYTNMNNPTGILGDKETTLYVMVRDDIMEGSTLYIREIADKDIHNNVTDGAENINGVQIKGIKLNKGLNIIKTQFDNSHLFIYYSVATASLSGSRYQPIIKNNLKNYSPIKIHIEGGRINGFFNYVGDTQRDTDGTLLYTGDKEEDFEYTVRRATFPMYDLIGRYLILHFDLEDTPNGSSDPIKGIRSALLTNRTIGEGRVYDPEVILRSWDRMCMSERILMGLQSDAEIAEFNGMYAEKYLGDPAGTYYESIVNTNDQITKGGTTYKLDPGFHYDEYFNNKLMGVSQNRDGLFMSATSWKMNFHVNTVESILTLFDRGDIWGPAHEYGHINQGPMNMAGTTEESNNIFSNVAVYFVGKNTSRSDFISSQFNVFQQKKNFLYNETWGTTRMFWQLWCYYHATGHNKKFYPRLYELLRNNPLKKVTRPGKHNERYDQLHFAKMCCLAAEEDLTDFFTAWGFFVPMDYMLIGDYSTYDAYLTQEDIDAVKAEIAAFELPKNESIILIDDRPGITDRTSFDGFPIDKAGEFGGLNDFRQEKVPQGNFSFTVSLNQVTIETDGNPGAGYIIRDQKGNLLGFSNTNSFEVSDELAEKLRTGEASVTAVGADEKHTTADVVNTILEGTDDQKKTILADLIKAAADVLGKVDATNKKVGYIKEEAAADLQEWHDKAVEQIAKDTPSISLSELIDKLSSAYNTLLDNDDNFIGIELGNTYVLYNSGRNNTQCALTTDGSVCTVTKTANQTSVPDGWQWFIQPQSDGSYYLKNYNTDVFVSSGGVQSQPYNVSKTDRIALELKSCRVKGSNIGYFSIAPPGSTNGMHITNQYTIIGWNYTSGASQWTIVKVHDSTDDALSGTLLQEYRSMLEGIIKQYESLEANIDPTGVKVGYLKPEAPEIIEEICNDIQAYIDDESLTVTDYERIYNEQVALYDDYSSFGSDLYINIEPGASYRIANVNNTSRVLSATSSTIVGSKASDAFMNQWIFNKSNVEGQYLIHNFEEKGYIPSKGIPWDAGISLKDKGDPYSLIPVENNLGHFGISADGYNMTSLVINDTGTAISLSAMTEEFGQWVITKVNDKEFVSLREKLAEEMDKAQDLLWNHFLEFPDMDSYMELWDKLEESTSKYNQTDITSEELKETLDDLTESYAKGEALVNNSTIVTVSTLQGFNDGTDESTGTVNRTAFNPTGTYTFHNFLTLSMDVDASNIQVSVEPADDWVRPSTTTDLSQAYKDAFAARGLDPKVAEQFDKLAGAPVDGFWFADGASARVVRSGQDGDSFTYDLVLKVPCSGAYTVSVASLDKSIAFFDNNNKSIKPVDLEIYPNLTAMFNLSKGFNIEGFEISQNGNTIVIPLSYLFENAGRLTQLKAYLPGTYFVNSFSVTVDALSGDFPQVDEPEVIGMQRITSSAAKGFNTSIDLTTLKTDPEELAVTLPLTISVNKNGASAQYSAYVTTHNDIPTLVIPVGADCNDNEVYYDLNGNRVKNPDHGIYIMIRNGKAHKIVK